MWNNFLLPAWKNDYLDWLLETAFPGIGDALAKDSTEVPTNSLPRAAIAEILQAAGSAATIVIAIKTMTPSVNVLLQGIEPGKSSQEIMETLQKTFHEQFVLPAQKNAGKMMIIVNAILEHVRKSLGI